MYEAERKCTGIKDKKGSFIYDGDLMNYYGSIYQVVLLEDNYFRFKRIRAPLDWWPLGEVCKYWTKSMYVVGNAYDSPKLLRKLESPVLYYANHLLVILGIITIITILLFGSFF